MHYIAIAEHERGLANLCDPGLFDDACDAMVEAFEKELFETVRVYRMELPRGNVQGKMLDVTDDAKRRIRYWNLQRDPFFEVPEWLEVA